MHLAPKAATGPRLLELLFRARWVPVVLALAVHAPSLAGEFWADDGYVILENPQVTGGAGWKELLLSDWFSRGRPGEAIGYWRPWVKASFRATHALAGKAPWAFHLGNVLLHALCVLALIGVLERLAPAQVAWVAGALFAVHPMTVQAVSIVTARSDVMGALFLLAALAGALRWDERPKAFWRALALLSCLGAMGSKESTMLLPLTAAVALWAMGRPWRDLARVGLPLSAVVAAMVAARLALGIRPIPNALASLGPVEKGTAVLQALGAYGRSLLTGAELVVLPRLPRSAMEAGVLLGVAGVAAGLAVWANARKGPVVASLALLGTGLAPPLAVWLVHIPMSVGDVPVAERWAYLPAAGAAALAALGLRRLPSVAAGPLSLALVAAFAAVSLLRSPHYRSGPAYEAYVASVLLERDFSELSPRDRFLAGSAEAGRLEREGRLKEAQAAYRTLQRLGPAVSTGYVGLSRVSEQLGEPEEVSRALEPLLSPDFATRPEAKEQGFQDDSWYRLDRAPLMARLAIAYARQGRLDRAAVAMRKAARLYEGRPEASSAWRELAKMLEASGDAAGAAEALGRAGGR